MTAGSICLASHCPSESGPTQTPSSTRILPWERGHLRKTLDLPAFEYRVISTLMEVFVSDLLSDFGLEKNQIGVAADIDCSFARIKTEDHCWRRRQHIHELFHSHAPFDHHLIVHNGES